MENVSEGSDVPALFVPSLQVTSVSSEMLNAPVWGGDGQADSAGNSCW